MGMRVLCLNSGAWSLKLSLFELELAAEPSERRLASGAVEGLAHADSKVWLRDADGKLVLSQSASRLDTGAALRLLLDALAERAYPAAHAVCHRLTHGGPDRLGPERLDPALLDTLPRLLAYAPRQLPGELVLVRAALAREPSLPHVVCFDSAFLGTRVPHDAGLRGLSARGLSNESIVQALGGEGQSRLVIAHLGAGATVTALHNGKTLDVDVLVAPAGDGGAELTDIQSLLARRESDPGAAEQVARFCYRLKKQLGACSAVLGGIDTLVFTGGLGEHAAYVRDLTCAGLTYLGIEINPPRNQANARMISRTGGRCTVRVLATDEERVMARQTAELLRGTT